MACLSPDDMAKLRAIVAALNVRRGQREAALGVLVRVLDGRFARLVGCVE